MRRRVYIAHTGGTIGMIRGGIGWRPEAGHLNSLLQSIPELQHPEMPHYELVEYDPLLDSANMSPASWSLIAEDIALRYEDFDGFVVLHGTDTLAYTASALSFMLENLSKPVICTGSQIPLCAVRSDARENIIDSLMVAGQFPVPEVCVQFGGQLLRGNRSVKISADDLDAFASPNWRPLGRGGVKLEVNWNRVRPSSQRGLHVARLGRARVASVRLYPGMEPELLRNFLQAPLQGVVLEAYGVGNAPAAREGFLEVIKEATSSGIVIVVTTQCLRGTVDLSGYATGSALASAGAISGFDMTPEAAMTKLYWLFGQAKTTPEVRALMQEDLRGELSLPKGPVWQATPD